MDHDGDHEREMVLLFLREHAVGLTPDAADAWKMAAGMIEMGLHADWWDLGEEGRAAIAGWEP